MNATDYVSALPHDGQWRVYVALLRAGVGGEDMARAMNSRLCDLEETIDVRRLA